MANIAVKAISSNSQIEGSAISYADKFGNTKSISGVVVPSGQGIDLANDRFDTKYTGWTLDR